MSFWLLISMISNKREENKKQGIIDRMFNNYRSDDFIENKNIFKLAPRDDMAGMNARDGGSYGYGHTKSSSDDGRCCIGIIIAIIIIVVIIIAYNRFI